MKTGKIISIFEISIEVVIEEDSGLKTGDILEVIDDPKYRFEVIEISK